jgi:hypothetical protein
MILAQVWFYHHSLVKPGLPRIQLGLLYFCITYRLRGSPENLGHSSRPFSFWQWSLYTQYIEFLAGLT